MREDTIKHLEFIQGAINRMANNCFLLKGWTVTLSAAFFALSAKDANPVFAIVALLPALSFWGLDAYYLRQERLFRALYNDVRKSEQRGDAVDAFTLATDSYRKCVLTWFRCLWSPAIIGLHGIIVAVLVTIIIILSYVSRSQVV